jgi:hypothetical protein
MDTVQDLEKKLLEAKVQEKLVSLQKELDALKEKYQGKAFGTHGFERRNRSGYASAKYYESFWIKNMKIHMLTWRVSFNRTGKNYVFSADQLSFDRSKAETEARDDGYNAEYHLINNVYGTKIITVEKFMQLWNYGHFVVTELDKVFTERLSKAEDLLRIGTNNDDIKLERDFKESGIEYVDITQKPKLFNVLKYKQLPMLQEQKFLPVAFAETVIQLQITKLEREKAERWCRNTEFLNKEIEVLREFLLELKEKSNTNN